jgi:hypothetical protein
MTAGEAGAPQADPVRIHRRVALQIGDRPAPVGDLPPRVNVKARSAVAGPEAAMVVHQHHESRISEHSGESLQPITHPGIAVGHRDTRVRTGPLRLKQPPAQRHVALDRELHIASPRHHPSFRAPHSMWLSFFGTLHSFRAGTIWLGDYTERYSLSPRSYPPVDSPTGQ